MGIDFRIGQVSKNILANLLANLWSVVLLLLLTPMYIELLGIEGYGLVGFYMSIAVIFGLLDTGISAAVGRDIAWFAVRPEGSSKIPELLYSMEVIYWLTVIVIGGFLICSLWFFGSSWFYAKEHSDTTLNHALMLMVGALVVQAPCGLYVGGLMGLQRQVECSAFMTFWGTVRGVGSIAVLLLWHQNIQAFFLFQFMAGLMQVFAMRWVLWKRVNDVNNLAKFSWSALHSIKGFASGMFLITLLSVLLSQFDKLMLSRLVSLELFSFYMLAWVVASGLTRVATPLIQAFSPYLTQLVSLRENKEMQRQLNLLCQLMSTLILPPAALVAVNAQLILFAWTGNLTMAVGSASFLSLLLIGTALTCCSYPALSALYSMNRIGLVIVINSLSLIIFLPLTVWAIDTYGAMGAASVCVIYGSYQYLSYQFYARRGHTSNRLFSIAIQNLIAPLFSSILVAVLTYLWLGNSPSTMKLILSLLLSLLSSCFIVLTICGDLRRFIFEKLK